MPPMYWSTGIQYSATSLSKGPFSNLGEQYLKKYQELSTKVSIVSVSLFAFPPHFGHFASTNSLHVSNGLPWPVNLNFSDLKYQELSTKVSIVSVSLFAFPPHFGHFASTNSLHVSNGLPWPVNLNFSCF